MRVLRKITLLVAGLLGCCVGAAAQEAITVIPQPAKTVVKLGEFVLKKNTRVVVVEGGDASANERVRDVARMFADWVAPATSFRLQVEKFQVEPPRTTSRDSRTTDHGPRTTKNAIILQLDPALERLGAEGYTLVVTRERVEIRAFAPAGIFYGVQTLRQLFPPEIFEKQSITTENAEDAGVGAIFRLPALDSKNSFAGGLKTAPTNFSSEIFEKQRITAENTEDAGVGAIFRLPALDSKNSFAGGLKTAPTNSAATNAKRRTRASAPTKPSKNIRWAAPCVEIEDRPRFAWRGAHMDVVRHFLPKEFVLKFIDVMAAHKLNVFHWHLTDDQGWRIEIKKYPRLTAVGAWRKETRVGKESATAGFDGIPHGGFYTQQEIREVVEYARRRFITVVPEIEMPGHAQAAIAAYPELGASGAPVEVMTYWGVSKEIFNVEESTISFLQDVLAEVLELFPSKFIHIGGDEAEKEQWRASPRVQQRMRELGVKDENELQSWFIRRMDTFLSERGRRLIGWDEILDGGLAAGATVMSWRGVKGGIEAAKAGHDVVMAPSQYTYLDHYQSRGSDEPLAIGGFTPLEKIYFYEPIPDALNAEESKRVLGAQAQLWTEYIASPEQLEYMAFPRLCALAEVVWSPRELRVWPNFLWRMRVHVTRLQRLGVRYRSPNKPVVPPPSNR